MKKAVTVLRQHHDRYIAGGEIHANERDMPRKTRPFGRVSSLIGGTAETLSLLLSTTLSGEKPVLRSIQHFQKGGTGLFPLQIHNHIGFIAAYRAFSSLFLLLYGDSRPVLNFYQLAGNNHVGFIATICTRANLALFSHALSPSLLEAIIIPHHAISIKTAKN